MRLCTLTWRGQIPLSRPDEEGRVLVALEEPGQTLSWDQVRELEAQQPVEIEAEPDSEAVASTLAPPRDFKVVHTTASAPLERSEMTAVLPFAQVGRPAAAMPFAPALQGGPERPP